MRDTSTIEHFAVIIWDGHHTDGGRIAVYPTMSSLMERLSVGDLLVEQTYEGRIFGRRAIIVDACRQRIMRDAAAASASYASGDTLEPATEPPVRRMTASPTLQLGA